MTAPDSLPLHVLVDDNLAPASPDLLRAMVKTFADALMSAETDVLCNAEYGQVSDERVNHRNGCRPREWDTRAGTVETLFPRWLDGPLEPAYLPQLGGSLDGMLTELAILPEDALVPAIQGGVRQSPGRESDRHDKPRGQGTAPPRFGSRRGHQLPRSPELAHR
ncbi:transposase [Streptomyces sp. NPDC007189]|uniref:transposase n=1 Tax=Streptomyces sp. NPDC007189 TaxID=3154315 RepID=UPI003455F4E5